MIVKPVGIENVVNWQDNGIFADTQKPVADDNYTLAGDVNQDNLYVGYMKEHGLKGKLSLPVLSSLGAITGRQTIGDCEVYKHVNGTTIIKGAVINQNLPDSRISLGFSADENGLQYYNNPNDPMPIKTINMAGLQKWEETDDYIIYVDKDAVMTTVQQYVTGTYDLFLEMKANIDGALELLKENGIEWTAEDDSKLLQDINLAQLGRIANTPTTMDEPTEIQTFEARTVPTTYECCFRTDKKTGEIYIGEGYENLFFRYRDRKVYDYTVSTISDTTTITTKDDGDSEDFGYGPESLGGFFVNFSFECEKINGGDWISSEGSKGNMLQIFEKDSTTRFFDFSKYQQSDWRARCKFYNLNLSEAQDSIVLKNVQITKTSTPKPFVKSVMPSGKLSFVTNATSETHSFVMQRVGCEVSLGNARRIFKTIKKQYITTQLGEVYSSLDIVVNFEKVFVRGVDSNYVLGQSQDFGTENTVLLNPNSTTKDFNFCKLLIYKGNLTESELKAENEKEINVGAYYHQENSVPLTYGIDSMKSMRVYSPALTDIEIVEEVNKNIYIPENRDGVPNYLGEVK